MQRILITAANGMFGSALATQLSGRDTGLRLMVRDPSKCKITGPHVETVVANMDDVAGMDAAFNGADAVFLCSPMDPRLDVREMAMIDLCMKHGVKHIVKIHGSVKHEGDSLSAMHGKVLSYLAGCGIPFTLISPNSVMETSLLPYAASIRYMHCIMGCSGQGRVGLVALKDIAMASATVLMQGPAGHGGMNYELTGPVPMSLYDVAAVFSDVLRMKIRYIDLSEDKLKAILMKFDKETNPERLDLEVLCHLRAWKAGKADLHTDTYQDLTGMQPTSLARFVEDHRKTFAEGIVPGFFAWMMRKANGL